MGEGHSLQSIAILKELPSSARERIEMRCSWRRFESGAPVLEYLDDSRDVLFLVEGAVRAVLYSPAGKAVSYRDLRAGSMFGELAAIDGAPRSVSIEATEQCLVAILAEQEFWSAVEEHKDFARALLRHTARYVRDLTGRVYEFSTLAVNNRLHAELLRLARDREAGARTGVISPAPTHAELAERLSTHREAVSRELSRLANIGIVSREGRMLHITDMERLDRMVREAAAE